VFGEYANDSSHIWLGYARDRKLADLGVAYERRLVRGHGSELDWQAEVQPLLFESDPTESLQESVNGTPVTTSITGSTTETTGGACTPASGSYSFPDPVGGAPTVVDYSITCGRRWTFGQAFSPIGLRYAMRTRHRLQPFVGFTGGYMFTTRPVPSEGAGSFNFSFKFDAGLELYRTATRSIAITARYHHFSNKNTASANPGTDMMVYKVAYNFGR
jgi:hypothetical protein